MQIVDYLKEEILQENLKVDEQVPSVRELAVRREEHPRVHLHGGGGDVQQAVELHGGVDGEVDAVERLLRIIGEELVELVVLFLLNRELRFAPQGRSRVHTLTVKADGESLVAEFNGAGWALLQGNTYAAYSPFDWDAMASCRLASNSGKSAEEFRRLQKPSV